MKDLEKVQKTLSDVFDYLNGNNLQLVGKELLTEVGNAHRIVENLAINGVVKSLPTEREVLNDRNFKTVTKPKTQADYQFNSNQLKKREGALWLLKKMQ